MAPRSHYALPAVGRLWPSDHDDDDHDNDDHDDDDHADDDQDGDYQDDDQETLATELDLLILFATI